MPARGLSTWGEGIVAAAVGDLEMMTALLNGEYDDKRGVDLRTMRTSYADQDFLAPRGVHIAANQQLVEIAMERDHEAVVMLLLEDPSNGAAPPPSVPLIRRAISECGPALLAEALRDHVARSLVVAADGEALAGLPQLRLGADERQTFVLPREAVSGLDGAARQAAIGLLLESVDVMPQIDAATAWWSAAVGAALGEPKDEVVPWWGLHALYTSGDGNCLLHAALLCTLGIRDRREAIEGEPGASTPEEITAGRSPRRTLRAALHHALVHCAPLRALLAEHGAPLGGKDGLESRSVLHGNSLEPGHILCLAHLFGRPIICYASADNETRDETVGGLPAASMGARMSGIYLPTLLDRRSSSAPPPSREPIVVCFTSGHFSAMVPAAAAADASVYAALGIGAPPMQTDDDDDAEELRAAIALSRPPAALVPLTDERRVPLPVVFAPEGWETARDLPSYLNIEHATLPVLMADGTPTGTAERVAVALLRVPPELSPRGGDHAAAYYAAVTSDMGRRGSERQSSRNSLLPIEPARADSSSARVGEEGSGIAYA